MNRETTPVLLLTGYLGSGKTTLLNRILSNKKGIKFAVIVNDIGEVNIDATLIEKGGVVNQQNDSLVALQNGCICCTLQTDLIDQLSGLVAQNLFDYIVIEASGICEPGPIAQTICAYPRLYPNLIEKGVAQLDAIVTVVDALRLRDEFAEGNDLTKQQLGDDDLANLVIQQVEFCNIILLNKASEVTPDERGRIRAIIRQIQPHAEIIDCDFCQVDLDKIIHTGLFDFEKVATSARWVEVVESVHHDEDEEEEEHEHHHEEVEHEHHHEEEEHEHHHDHDEHQHHGECHHHHHHHHHGEGEALEYGISTFVYFRRRAFDMNKFDYIVTKKWPKSVIRCKGICYFSDEQDMCYVFEQAGKQVRMSQAGNWFAAMSPDELEELKTYNPAAFREWDDQVGDRMQKLVFIGQDMDREAIIKDLDYCLEEE